MTATTDLPSHPRDVNVHLPMVSVGSAWEYKHVVRSVADDGPLDQAMLNALGAEGWELAGVVGTQQAVHFYFKRPAA